MELKFRIQTNLVNTRIFRPKMAKPFCFLAKEDCYFFSIQANCRFLNLNAAYSNMIASPTGTLFFGVQSTTLNSQMYYFPMMSSFLAVDVTKRPVNQKLLRRNFEIFRVGLTVITHN